MFKKMLARFQLKPEKTKYEVPIEDSRETLAPGLHRTRRQTVVGKRERSSSDKAKEEAMLAFIKIAANEDLDPLFLALFNEAGSLGYNLKSEPYRLLHQLNNVR